MSDDNIAIVTSFVAAWSGRDLDAVMGYFTPDAFYHNIPMEPVQGVAAIQASLAGFVAMSEEIMWELRHIAATAEGIVLTERTDGFKMGGKWIRVRVMGAFELTDGKISAWRDYFDLAQFQAQMTG
jgi:limonene-1,2-epoxide hydrolase